MVGGVIPESTCAEALKLSEQVQPDVEGWNLICGKRKPVISRHGCIGSHIPRISPANQKGS